MRIRTSWIVGLGLAIAVPAWAHCGFCASDAKGKTDADSHAQAEVGKPAPAFALKGVDGKEYSLASAKGKVVVLEWINHECPVVNRCHRDKIIKETRKRFEGKPVVWMAIDSSYFAEDKADASRKWAKEQGIPYPLLLDANGKVGHLYAAKTTPHMYVIDTKGILAYTGAIDDSPYGDKKDSRNYVEEAVDALLAGSTVAVAKTKSYGCGVKYKG